MKKLLFSFSLATSVFLISCGGSNVNYNDKVVNLYSRYSTEMEKAIGETNTATEPAAKKAAIDRLEKLTDSCSTAMNEMKPTDEGKEFHQSVTALYGSVKADFIPVYKKLLAIEKPDDNVDEYNKLIEEVNAVSDKITKLEDKAIQDQKVFAQKTNTRLQ